MISNSELIISLDKVEHFLINSLEVNTKNYQEIDPEIWNAITLALEEMKEFAISNVTQ